ncbi:MAG: Ig domain-containing protein [Blastocatellales bacterium]
MSITSKLNRRRLLFVLFWLALSSGILFSQSEKARSRFLNSGAGMPFKSERVQVVPNPNATSSSHPLTNNYTVTIEPMQSGGNYNITQSVIAGGGAESAGGNYSETGTVGESTTGESSGGNYSLSGGFWNGGNGGGCAAISVSPMTLPNGQIGQPYSQQLSQSGGAVPITWSVNAGALPNNVMLDAVTGLLSGTPTASGNFNFTARATGIDNCFGEQSYTLVIDTCPVITITPGSLPVGTAGMAYSQQLTAMGGTPAYTFNLSAGALPTGLMLSATGLISGTTASTGLFNFTVNATDLNNCMGTQAYSLTINPVGGASGLQYYPLPKPIRLFDTRAPIPGFPACQYLSQPLVANGELVKNARITCDSITIPANAAAIVGNATVIAPATAGFITLWPDGQARPPVSNLNFTAGQVVPNAFTVGLSGAGDFRVYSTSNADFALDVTGYFAPPASGLYYHPLPKPIRLFDTRATIPGFPACEYLNQQLIAGGELSKQARITCDGITIPADAMAIVGNATVVQPTGNGFITLWPDGQARPPVSNLNFVTGQVVPNAFTVGLGASGEFRTFSSSNTNFIVDITGYYSPSATDANGAGLLYSPLSKPIRLFDTRATIPGFPACEYLNQALVANGELVKSAHTTCDGVTIPATAAAIVGNATVVQPAGNGFITLWPDGQARPPVSNLNYVTGQVVPNAFTVGLNASGNFRTYSFAGTNFIVDVTGYFAP